MGILDSILKDADGGLVGQLAESIGVDRKTAEAAVKSLTPALSRGLTRNISSEQGMGSLLDALDGVQHARTLDDFPSFDLDKAIHEGNDVLGHILGSKDVSRNVAGAAAKQSGLSASLLKKMLPLVAMMVMGMMKRETSAKGASRKSSGGLLTSFLDSDDDGSVLDDVLSMAVKFF